MTARKIVSDMTLEEVRAERLRATREYLDLLEGKEQELAGEPVEATVSKSEIADPRFVKWALPDAVVAYLGSCQDPQAAKQIATALKRAGREFDTDNPVHAVGIALKKAMAKNEDVFHVGSAKYHLRSKYRGKARKLEKLMAKANGTGGQTKKEHSRRTSEGIAKRRSEGLASWGPAKKATPEVIERAKEMMRKGITLTETCRRLKIAIPTLYQYGVRQRALKKEGQRPKELPLDEPKEAANVVKFAKS